MKISYERLNQIIEEEVVRFKRLNEDTSAGPGATTSTTPDASSIKGSIQELLKTKLDSLNNDTKKLQDFYTKLLALS